MITDKEILNILLKDLDIFESQYRYKIGDGPGSPISETNWELLVKRIEIKRRIDFMKDKIYIDEINEVDTLRKENKELKERIELFIKD
jgi:hypothetical protein